jgi:dephospho-CoA kinase
VGLTGGIAAGKSEALAALSRLGAATLSTDAVVHELLEEAELRDLIVGRLGDDAAPGGRIDRAAVARATFAAPAEREWLEGVLWPRVGERIASWYADLREREPPPVAAVVEVPLLFESGMEGAFEATVAVVASKSERARRASAREHVSIDERAARQLSQEDKAARADYVVANDGSIADLEASLSRVLATIVG